MRTGRVLVVLGCALALGTGVLLTPPSVDAGRPFGPAILNGAYHFSVAEIRIQTDPLPVTTYCNAYGVIEFDGAGRAEILPDTGFGWCRDGDGNDVEGDPAEPGCFDYEVFADGSVILTELTDPPACAARPAGEQYTTHCQILDKGKLLLCDGTGGGGDIPPGLLLWTGSAGKL